MAAGPLFVVAINLFLIHLGGVQTYEDKFSEELYIKRLPNSFLYTHFQFTTVAKSRSTATGMILVTSIQSTSRDVK